MELLRVEILRETDMASVTPHLGGASRRIDPLPAKLVSARRRLAFLDGRDGARLERLALEEARALEPAGQDDP